MPSFAVSPPAAHRPGGKIRVDGHDVNLCVAKESVNNVLPGRPQPSLDDDAQLNTDSGGHQPGESLLEAGGKYIAPRLAEDDRHGRRGINDKAPPSRFCQRGSRPVN